MNRLVGPLVGAVLLLNGCGRVTDTPFIPEISGNYAFAMQYAGACSSAAQPGTCAVSPVSLLQSQGEIVVQPLGAGTVERVAVVFASDEIAVCDLTDASLVFAGVYDGRDVRGTFSGTFQRAGFGECSLEDGSFSLTRIASGER